MNTSQQLFEAIGQRCAAQKWYGADLLGPEWKAVLEDDPQRTGFGYPPATAAQLQETENQLGLPLPPVLRACYSGLANGGFGPAYGLRGVIGGYDHLGTLLGRYESRCDERVVLDLDVMATSGGGKRVFEIPFDRWLRTMLPLLDEGCTMEICLDVTTGAVFRVEPSPTGYTFTYQAPTLETLLGLWLCDELYPKKAAPPTGCATR